MWPQQRVKISSNSATAWLADLNICWCTCPTQFSRVVARSKQTDSQKHNLWTCICFPVVQAIWNRQINFDWEYEQEEMQILNFCSGNDQTITFSINISLFQC